MMVTEEKSENVIYGEWTDRGTDTTDLKNPGMECVVCVHWYRAWASALSRSQETQGHGCSHHRKGEHVAPWLVSRRGLEGQWTYTAQQRGMLHATTTAEL